MNNILNWYISIVIRMYNTNSTPGLPFNIPYSNVKYHSMTSIQDLKHGRSSEGFDQIQRVMFDSLQMRLNITIEYSRCILTYMQIRKIIFHTPHKIDKLDYFVLFI